MPSVKYVAVVAIDFGTTHSTFAFAFNNEYRRGERGIQLSKGWGVEQGLVNTKTPTCILLNSDETFNNFGYEAQQRFMALSASEARKYLYFERFKMKLHGEQNKVIDKFYLTAQNGNNIKAIVVFAHAIRFLKEKAIEVMIERAGERLPPEKIQWVLTVPAIWTSSAKKFMREAAYEAGLVSKDASDQLIIALEPEAASLNCRKRSMRDFLDEKGEVCIGNIIAKPDTNYVLVDTGGGTVDITVHHVTKDDHIEELYRPTGGPWGGMKVEEEYETMLSKIFGESFIKTYRSNFPGKWLEMIRELEIKKRSSNALTGKPTKMHLPVTFILAYNEKFGNVSMNDKIRQSYKLSDVKYDDEGELELSAEIMQSLHKAILDSIIGHLQKLLEEEKVRGISCMFVVGGFSESPILQHKLRSEFGRNYRILIPSEASLAVVKGAVMFGERPEIVQKRICRKTYGISVCKKFDPRNHLHDYRFGTTNGPYCKKLFRRLAVINEEIRVGDVRTYTFNPIEATQKEAKFIFYVTDEENAKYVDEPHVSEEGTHIAIPTPPSATTGKSREIELRIKFGGAEIMASAINVETKQNVTVHINMIPDGKERFEGHGIEPKE
ncbi:heat shock 70 kDa protein 12A-like [Glandiceps talaboti]